LKTLVQWLIQRILASSRLKILIQGWLAKQPRLDFWLRHRVIPFIFNQDSSTQTLDTFKDINLETVQIKFHTAALADNRGIGRVSQALLNELQQLVPVNLPKIATSTKVVHFYPTVHWCPQQLPHPSCILIHDVIPLIFPQYFGQISQHWQQQLKPIAQQADQIITISQASAKDIAQYLDIPIDKIQVIYNGISALQWDKNAAPNTLNLPASVDLEKPYIVFLGSNDPHKNIEIVLKALPLLADTSIQLYLIGHNETVLELAKQHGVAERIQILGRLDDQQLAVVVHHAIALVFPSLYEGFGLPPFEAAFLGTASICSRRPAMTELLEGACLFCDPDNPRAWAEAIQQYVDNAALREEMQSNAQKIAQQLNWNSAAKNFVRVLSDIPEYNSTQIQHNK
jgi:glycosyltransferase involved in cell wall biosynthesis